MIKQEDIEFHTPAGADYLWAETNYFSISIPEERLLASVYVVHRKGLGVMSADVAIHGALVDTRAECLYVDNHQHLPAPERLSDVRTPTGLRIQAFSPRDYRIDYAGFDDTGIHVDFKGLMEPFDIHDPAHSPKATTDAVKRIEGSGFGTGYGGHFDLTGRITGTLKVRGKEYPVDCIETMDHSWGPRPETHMPGIGWQHAHFGEDLALHWIVLCDYEKPVGRQQTLAHGYVLDQGEVYGLTDLKLRTVRTGVVTCAHEFEATDVRGKTWRMYGSAEVGAPWVCYVSTMVYIALMRWTLPDGRVGHGVSQENQSVQSLNRQRGKHWTEPSSKITS
ncbi:hypothetical protein BN940_14141 [Castellaniella defragrans 65Phen]|jgi:hypothetical protein|uniref:Uncharacterized protein n=2 Tax=Castellaniella defragrans TaxID=75697 RepID=W8WZS3_CASD6|nr:hypothetical protein [Castellaniella defragrans]KAB0622728.1 hypothetical protein F7Q88_02580 [Castellaniella defragrans]MBB6085257.1 hypothetical protein [Castellaniella defragrans]CDM25273.1 hypothetical protein BN940_14141 [Castellaniella defragrans 65Phen]